MPVRSGGALSRRAVLASGACLVPGTASPQPAGRPMRIALLPDFVPRWLTPFVQGLKDHGRVEGRDYVLLHSGVFYGPQTDRAVQFAVEARPDLIFAVNLGYVIAAHKLTKTIPIVMGISGFPVEGGVADSLARPGRNVTGMTIYAGAQVFAKLVQLLAEARPGIRRLGALCSYVPPFHPIEEVGQTFDEIREAGQRLGIDTRLYEIARPEQTADALGTAWAENRQALLLTSGAPLYPRREDVLRFAIDRRWPTISDTDWSPQFEGRFPYGAMLSYGADISAVIREAADYVEHILWRGARPAQLPIRLPTKFTLVASTKMAGAIGMQLPRSILQRADRVFD